MNRELLVFGILLFVFFAIFAVTTTITSVPVLADANDTVTLDVNVTAAASITVWPESLNWTSVATGGVGGYNNLTVKNAGSVNVTDIYGYVDTLVDEGDRPYGSSNPLEFAAGGVITIRNETDTKYYFAGRIEWNWTEDIPTHDFSAVTSPIAWGYFRNASNDYVWVLGNGTDGRCNESDAEFSVETQVDLGTLATRTPDNTETMTASAGDPERWSYAHISSGPLQYHCVAAYHDCTKIFIYNYDKRTNFTGCAGAEYLYAGNLTTGDTFPMRVDAWVPNGYPGGYLNTSTLTIYGTSTP